jgi:hypothetical protein
MAGGSRAGGQSAFDEDLDQGRGSSGRRRWHRRAAKCRPVMRRLASRRRWAPVVDLHGDVVALGPMDDSDAGLPDVRRGPRGRPRAGTQRSLGVEKVRGRAGGGAIPSPVVGT